jgi:hypothetical protein
MSVGDQYYFDGPQFWRYFGRNGLPFGDVWETLKVQPQNNIHEVETVWSPTEGM